MSNRGKAAAIVDAPVIALDESDKTGDVLIKFYRALGWNGADILDPRKVRTTKTVYIQLTDLMYERCSDDASIAMFMVNRGPGVDDDVPEGKVYLCEGWVAEDESE